MDLKGQPAEVHMTIEVKRKATGKVERFNVVGRVEPGNQEEVKEQIDGDNAQRSGA